tara:strand:+ start:343 stop:1221 length:879 start_codon:yes stop_codon:yes gene_type:complete
MNSFGSQDMVSSLKKVLMKKPQKMMSKVNSKKWNYIHPMNQKLISKNYEEFYKIIKNFGTEIIELELENENEELCDSTFTHDPSIVINDGAIILNMGKKLRKKEAYAHLKLYQSIDVPILGKIINDGTVEGGDCLWINKKTLIVGESDRTNKSGINQLSDILQNHGLKVISVKIPKYNDLDSCFHLMSMISLLDEDLAIAKVDMLPNNLIDIFKEYKIKLINIPDNDYKKSKTLAVNILCLSQRNLIMMKGYPETEDLLIKENNKLNLFDGSELCIKAEGGPTCLTRPILRE